MAMYHVIVIIAFIFVQNTNPNSGVQNTENERNTMYGVQNTENDRDTMYGVQNRQNRIIGGNRAQPNEFPWQALLTFKTSSWFCSGSVISTRNVLSSAHCNDREKV